MSKPIKNILYLHANNIDIGGADFCLFKLVSNLDRSKFNPIVGLNLPTSIVELYENAGTRVKIIKMKRIKRTKNPLYFMSYFLNFFLTVSRIYCLIRKEKIDLIHSNDLQDIYGAFAARLAGIPATQHIRLIIPSPKILKNFLTTLVCAASHRVLTVSDGVARDMFTREGGIHRKVITCYDWLDMDRVGHTRITKDIRKEFNIPKNGPLIGVVGRLEHWKGQDVFVKATPLIAEHFPEARFMIVGGIVEGRQREYYPQELKSLAQNLGTLDKIIFTGHRTDIANIMSSLDILVHTSVLPDPLPGVVIEAMACEKPVVGANAGGVPEEVEDRITGILYPPGDHVKMAEAVLHLLRNPNLAKEMGQAGKKRASKVFDKELLCKRIENIYRDLLET